MNRRVSRARKNRLPMELIAAVSLTVVGNAIAADAKLAYYTEDPDSRESHVLMVGSFEASGTSFIIRALAQDAIPEGDHTRTLRSGQFQNGRQPSRSTRPSAVKQPRRSVPLTVLPLDPSRAVRLMPRYSMESEDSVMGQPSPTRKAEPLPRKPGPARR